ncbi:hypothetical protein [Luteimonas aquatica]|uniref:hypothetical protein n=1 Tax=Luteimonas aquatica TaxID=450364 RepID=UPI001F593BDD|nr:hypothetical protein [Luteimonas aquatica]
MAKLRKQRKVEFPDRKAFRRRQRSGAWMAVLVVVAAVAGWGGYRLYHKFSAQKPPPPKPAPVVKPPPPPPPKPAPPDPVVTRAARMAALHEAMQRGDEVATQKQIDGLQEDFRKSMRFVDPGRVDAYEAARAAAWKVGGVRSLAWLDRVNLYVIVDTPEHRSQATIDAVCEAVRTLSDKPEEKPDVVVDLQVDFRGREPSEMLARNCRAAPVAENGPDAQDAQKKDEDAKPDAAKDKPAEEQDPVREESLRILRDTTPEL